MYVCMNVYMYVFMNVFSIAKIYFYLPSTAVFQLWIEFQLETFFIRMLKAFQISVHKKDSSSTPHPKNLTSWTVSGFSLFPLCSEMGLIHSLVQFGNSHLLFLGKFLYYLFNTPSFLVVLFAFLH